MRTEKIGRNDPCFCGSGKKYKFCCLGKAEQTIPASDVPFATVSESFALRTLLAASKPFRAFYGAERPKIVAPLLWTRELPMPVNMEVQAIRLPTSDFRAIYLRRIPAVADHAHAVAHEIMHLVLDAQGFPFIVSAREHQPVAALLNSLVQDPLIDARLRQYGFDIGKQIRKDIKASLAGLEHAEPPLDRIARMMWVLNYTAQILECNIAAPAETREHVAAFAGWFSAHHSAIQDEGDELLSAVQQIGYDTPERMRGFFRWITQRYGIADDFVVG